MAEKTTDVPYLAAVTAHNLANKVERGTTVYTTNGQHGVYEYATQPTERGKAGKVMVSGREYYANVWGLSVLWHRKEWTYTTQGNGATVTIYAPDGRTAFLQGDDAKQFLHDAEGTNDKYTDADLCKEYESVVDW